MVTIEFSDSGLQAVMVDGYLPYVRSNNESESLDELDDLCMTSLAEKLIALGSEWRRPQSTCDIHIVRPREHPQFFSRYAPVHEAALNLESKCDHYRLIIAIANDNVRGSLSKSLNGALEPLGFRARGQQSYADAEKFVAFGRDLLKEIVNIYAGPHITTRRILEKLDLDSMSVTV